MKKITRFISLLLILCILSGMNMFRLEYGISHAENNYGTSLKDDESVGNFSEVSSPQISSETKAELLVSELKKNSLVMDYIDEDVFLNAKPVARLTEKEQLNTYHFLNDDGSESVYILDQNVKYVSESGVVREKNIKLANRADSYNVSESDIDVAIPKVPSDGISFSHSGKNVKIVPQNGNIGVRAQLNSADNSVTYNDYFGSGIDLRYTPILTGVKEDIILSSYSEMSSFEFILVTNGLNVYSSEEKYYISVSEDSDDKIYLGDVIAYDAVGRPEMGTLEVETVKESSEYLLTISVSKEFLSDPMTMYPVTIDPTLEICDNIQGFNSIIDATVFEGFPTQNFGDYQYCTLGQLDQTYGRARTFIKLSGLLTNEIYQSLNANDITNAKLYVKEGSGLSSLNVSLHYNQDTTAWSETNITWNRTPMNLSGAIATANLNNNEWTSFEITDYIKRCKTAELSLNAGLIMRLTGSETETFRQYDSSEHGIAGFRPYLALRFDGDADMSLSNHTIDINEGQTFTITAITNPADVDIVWSSDDTNVAQIIGNGVVRGRKAGVATVYAQIKGTSIRRSCSVYVTIPDNVYIVQNMDNNLVLDVENNGISDYTDIVMYHQNEYEYGLNQRWRIKHLGMGFYSVRPVHKLDRCLSLSYSTVFTRTSDTDEDINNTPADKRWTITYEVIEGTTSKGYVFKTAGGGRALSYEDATSDLGNKIVIAETRDLSSQRQAWTLSTAFYMPENGIRIYDPSQPGIFYDSIYHAEIPYREVVLNKNSTAADMNMVVSYYTRLVSVDIDQEFVWQSSNENVLLYFPENDIFYSYGTGMSTLSVSKQRGASRYTANINVRVILSGDYYIKNKTAGRFVSENNAVAKIQNFVGTDSQKWELNHIGNGYYTIKSKSNEKVLSVNPSNPTVLDNMLVLADYNSTDLNQQWMITGTPNSGLKVKAKSTEGNASLVAAVNSTSAGSFVINGDYVDNNSYMDEWMFVLDGGTDVAMLAIEDPEHNRLPMWQSVVDDFSEANHVGIDFRFVNSINYLDCIEMIENSRIFIVRTHGIQTSDTENAILLSNKNNDKVNYLSTTSLLTWCNGNEGTSGDKLSNCDLIMLVACKTAYGGLNADNLVTAAAESGAKAVIGFETNIYADRADLWTQVFCENYISGRSIEESKNIALEAVRISRSSRNNSNEEISGDDGDVEDLGTYGGLDSFVVAYAEDYV